MFAPAAWCTLPAFPVCRIPSTVRVSQSVFTSEDYVFHKNCSSSIAASPMSRLSIHPWAEHRQANWQSRENPENEAGGEKKIVHCHRNSKEETARDAAGRWSSR
ncbi:hypothetical protein NKI56_20610 [Mesorhizobium sp. M0622]